MSYKFNPHNHVKIWLSKKPESFLNFENQKRLIKTRYKNPNDTIHFIYAENLLNDKAKQELADFCEAYNITPVSVEHDIIPACETEREQELAKWYQHEIDNLSAGGNPASASDILRWVSPVYRRGTYSDFDVDIETHALPETVDVDESLLLHMGSMNLLSSSANVLSYNNDVIAVVDEEKALEKIQKAQDGIINAYTNYTRNFAYTSSNDALHKEIPEAFPWFLRGILTWFLDTFLAALSNAAKELDGMQKLEEDTKWLTPTELRGQLIEERHSKPLIYAQRACRALGYDASKVTEENYIEEVCKQHRQILASKTNWLGWFIRPSAQYKELSRQLTLSDEELYQIVTDEAFRYISIQSVLNTTGPFVLLLSMFGKTVYSNQAIQNKIAPYAFSHYRLGEYFDLSNGEQMNSSVLDGLWRLFSLESSEEVGDVSWIDSGVKKQQAREERIKEKITETTRELPDLMAELLDEISRHKHQIQGQLDGLFGFYRHDARREKIAALDSILAHSKDGQFDVRDFYANSYKYHSKGIEAAIGKSQTKALIDRCEKLCEMAIFCDIKTIDIAPPQHEQALQIA